VSGPAHDPHARVRQRVLAALGDDELGAVAVEGLHADRRPAADGAHRERLGDGRLLAGSSTVGAVVLPAHDDLVVPGWGQLGGGCGDGGVGRVALGDEGEAVVDTVGEVGADGTRRPSLREELELSGRGPGRGLGVELAGVSQREGGREGVEGQVGGHDHRHAGAGPVAGVAAQVGVLGLGQLGPDPDLERGWSAATALVGGDRARLPRRAPGRRRLGAPVDEVGGAGWWPGGGVGRRQLAGRPPPAGRLRGEGRSTVLVACRCGCVVARCRDVRRRGGGGVPGVVGSLGGGRVHRAVLADPGATGQALDRGRDRRAVDDHPRVGFGCVDDHRFPDGWRRRRRVVLGGRVAQGGAGHDGRTQQHHGPEHRHHGTSGATRPRRPLKAIVRALAHVSRW
jgi:hypothetical protein